MMFPARTVALLLLLFSSFVAADNPRVIIKTSMGDITVELLPEDAPLTVDNFLGYVDRGAYDGTIFHRVIPGFMIQGGGYFEDMGDAPEEAPIRNEAANGLANTVGTLAMAREDIIDSAARQFFINVDDNTHLDHSAESCTREDEAAVAAARERGLRKPLTCETYGYAVFGRVVAGMGTVESIEVVETEWTDDFDDLPVEPVVIHRIRRLGVE